MLSLFPHILKLIGHMLDSISMVINICQLLEQWFLIEMRCNVALLNADLEVLSIANVGVLSASGIEQRASAVKSGSDIFKALKKTK